MGVVVRGWFFLFSYLGLGYVYFYGSRFSVKGVGGRGRDMLGFCVFGDVLVVIFFYVCFCVGLFFLVYFIW